MIEGLNTNVMSLPVSVEIKKKKEGEEGEEKTERSLPRTGKM